MKKVLLLVAVALLASCGAEKAAQTTTQNAESGTQATVVSEAGDITISGSTNVPTVEYPTSLTDNPATKYCEEQGGRVVIQKENDIDMAYCNINNETIDAWKYFSDTSAKIEK